MDAYNKKSMFFLLAIAILVCSSFADSLPQARMEEQELVAIDAFSVPFRKFLGKFGTEEGWRDTVKESFDFLIEAGQQYNKVVHRCPKINNCTPTNPAQHPSCGKFCEYYMYAKREGIAKRCVKYCSEQEERSALPNLKSCRYHANGRITCN